MILSDYIKQVLQNSSAEKVEFDIAIFPINGEIVVDDGNFPNSPSPNRIKFTIEKTCPNETLKAKNVGFIVSSNNWTSCNTYGIDFGSYSGLEV